MRAVFCVVAVAALVAAARGVAAPPAHLPVAATTHVAFVDGRYVVDRVAVSGVDGVHAVSVVLTGRGSRVLARINGGGGEHSWALRAPVDAASVTGVSVVVD